jgi:hypothetical protein
MIWEPGPGIEPKWLLRDENGVILWQIVDRGKDYGGERFIVSAPGHVGTCDL